MERKKGANHGRKKEAFVIRNWIYHRQTVGGIIITGCIHSVNTTTAAVSGKLLLTGLKHKTLTTAFGS
jgi:hypothetical protein